jgi:hypothetical protein
MARPKTPVPAHPERLDEARRRLAEFEASATQSELLARLRAHAPVHPWLVMRAVALVSCVACGGATVASLVVPWLDRGLAQQMVALEVQSGLAVPVALGILTVCAGVVLFASQAAAISAARDVPWRPHEAKVLQRLTSDLRQLEAESAVRERLTPRSASPRMVPRT